MNENEMKLEKVIAEDYKIVLHEAKSMGCNNIKALYHIPLKNMELIIKALEEAQQYRKIGTVEECRAAVKKQTAKKIIRREAIDEDAESELRDFITRRGMIYSCPTCGSHIAVEEMKNCWECGQLLDWSDEA